MATKGDGTWRNAKRLGGVRSQVVAAINRCMDGAQVELDIKTARNLVEVCDQAIHTEDSHAGRPIPASRRVVVVAPSAPWFWHPPRFRINQRLAYEYSAAEPSRGIAADVRVGIVFDVETHYDAEGRARHLYTLTPTDPKKRRPRVVAEGQCWPAMS